MISTSSEPQLLSIPHNNRAKPSFDGSAMGNGSEPYPQRSGFLYVNPTIVCAIEDRSFRADFDGRTGPLFRS